MRRWSRRAWRAIALGALASASVVAAPVQAGPRVLPDVALQQLFERYGNAGRNDRWTGGDSAISIRLPDGRVLWTGGDTFLGTVERDGSRAPQGFIHNSYVVQNRDGRLGPTLFTRVPGRPDDAKIRTGDPASWYWLLDAFVEGVVLRQFVIRVTGSLAAFSVVSTEVASLSLPSLAVVGVAPARGAYAPVAGGGFVSYGVAVVPVGAWTYVYGIETFALDKHLHVARARTGSVLTTDWEYWDGSGWGRVAALSKRLLSGVGDEMSVVRTRRGFRAVASQGSIGPDIYLWTATRPEGPWGGRTHLYRTPESNDKTFTYNAKEHVERAGRDSISISYNVNVQASNANGLYTDVRNYRPRFIRVYVPPDL